MNTPDLMHERLRALAPHSIDILDDSQQHAGHAGAAGGGGHYKLLLVSARFHGLSLPARHRMVYDALGSLMGTSIHALSIRALTPDEI